MRIFVACAIVVCVCGTLSMPCHAAGMYVPGKEDCTCSPLVKQGLMPDTLNKLAQAFYFPSVARAVDTLAGEVKAILSQFGIQTAPHLPEAKPTASVEPKKETKSRTKARRIKRPPLAM